MKLKEYEKMLKDHDWYYTFSDDKRYYDKARAVEEKLIALADNDKTLRKLFMLYADWNSVKQISQEVFNKRKEEIYGERD